MNTGPGSLGLTHHGFAANDVLVVRDDPDPAHPAGNRIKFVGGGVVTSLGLNVPDSGTNGAITDLGFAAGTGEVHRAKADAFFLDNAVPLRITPL